MSAGAATELTKIPEERADEAAFLDKLDFKEIAFLVTSILLWTVLLAVGMFISSGSYRDALVTTLPRMTDYAFAWFMAFISYTFTNVALLSCLASMAGAGARHVEAQLSNKERIANLRARSTPQRCCAGSSCTWWRCQA